MQDAVGAWLENASRTPIPTKNEQIALGRLVQQGQQPGATKAQIRAGKRAADRLVSGNLRLVVPIARKFLRRVQGSALSMEDLLQAGTLGLIHSVNRFDPERGYSLTTPSYWWISQAIRRAIQDADKTIRTPIHALDTLRRYKYRPEGMTATEFCQEWSISEAKLKQELEHEARANCASLDAKLQGAEADGSELGDRLADPNNQPCTDYAEMQQVTEWLRDLAPDEMALVELQVVDEVQIKDLAVLNGVTRGTAATALQKAKQRLAVLAGSGARQLVA